MNSEVTKNFLKMYRAACRYGVDVFEERSVFHGISDGDDFESLLSLSKTTSTDDFFQHLYISRPEEKKIAGAITATSRLLCVVGPKGSGKTTVVKKVLNDFLRRSGLRVIIDLDVRRLRPDGSVAIGKFLSQQAMNAYYDKFFNLETELPGDGERIGKIALQAFLLTARGAEMRKFSILRDQIKMLYCSLERQSLKTHVTVDMLYDFLLKHSVTELAVKQVLDHLESETELLHLVIASVELLKAKQQVIWYDNLDHLDGQNQAQVFESLKTSHVTMPASVVSVVCVREENIRHYVQTEQSAPSFADFVMVSPTGQIGGIGLGNFDEAAIGHILEARFAYTRVRMRQMASVAIGQEKEHYTLDSNRDAALVALSKRLLVVMHRERALHLTNNSLRELLLLHSEALDQYRQIIEELRNSRLDSEDWFLTTVFLRWLRRFNHIVPMGMYEVAEIVWTWRNHKNWGHVERPPRAPACVLEHVLATCLWNLESEKVIGARPVRPPTVESLTSRMEKIGYGEDEVRAKIFELYRLGGSTGNIVDFCTEANIESEGDIKGHYLLFLTHRGRCLTNFTCNTFGFILEGYIKFIEERVDGTGSNKLTKGVFLPSQSYRQDLVWSVVDFLCDLGSMYCEGLSHVGKRLRHRHGNRWLSFYKQWFGIPHSSDRHSRSKASKSAVKAFNRLHFEAILNFERHLSSRLVESGPEILQVVNELRRQFEDYVKVVEYDPEAGPVDLREKILEKGLRLPSRRWFEADFKDFVAH